MFIMRMFLTRRLAPLLTLGFLVGCSGGTNCGSCAVPAFHATPTPTPTPAVLSCSQGASSITLGPALAPFAILAGSGVSNVGNTLVTYAPGAVTGGINDDLIGMYPNTASSGITGWYPPGTDTNGPAAIYGPGYTYTGAAQATLLAAQNDLTTAFNTAALVPATATFTGGTDLSQASVTGYPTGTLPPGVYKSPSSFLIQAGNLTLDGAGNPRSVFIFQMGSTLTTTLNGGTSGNIILKNGASPCNIYWQVGSSATLGGQTFYGDVLAYSSVTINASTFTGRALAGGSSLGDGAVSIPVAGGSLITNPGGN